MDTKELLKRVDYLLDKGNAVKESKWIDARKTAHVDYGQILSFRAASLSFIHSIFGAESIFCKEFDNIVTGNYMSSLSAGIGILESIRYEIEQGWIISYKSLLAAELFTDFLEMSEHLLEEGYEDAAAVMIGSVLEEHLRQLCYRYKVDIYIQKGIDEIPKKADVLNADLKKVGAYGPLDQKQVTAWLGLRNSAAHGKYTEYTIEQVKLMYQGVLDFIARVK